MDFTTLKRIEKLKFLKLRKLNKNENTILKFIETLKKLTPNNIVLKLPPLYGSSSIAYFNDKDEIVFFKTNHIVVIQTRLVNNLLKLKLSNEEIYDLVSKTLIKEYSFIDIILKQSYKLSKNQYVIKSAF